MASSIMPWSRNMIAAAQRDRGSEMSVAGGVSPVGEQACELVVEAVPVAVSVELNDEQVVAMDPVDELGTGHRPVLSVWSLVELCDGVAELGAETIEVGRGQEMTTNLSGNVVDHVGDEVFLGGLRRGSRHR